MLSNLLLDATVPKGMTVFPHALGRREEERDFYETEHSMCSSLYKPNETYLGLFQNLGVARLKKKTSVRTISLDHFSSMHDIGPVDFIKIDIQGAELDVFRGGRQLLNDVLLIASEVVMMREKERPSPRNNFGCLRFQQRKTQFRPIIETTDCFADLRFAPQSLPWQRHG